MKEEYNISSSFPRVGLNLSTDPLSFQEGDYSFLLNGALYGIDGKQPSVRMLPGNKTAFPLKPGFYVIGNVDIHDNQECLFLVNPATGVGSIGISDGVNYTELAASSKLNFRIDRQIQAVFDKDYSDVWMVIWTDDNESVRYMDLKNPPLLNGELDVEALTVFRQSSYPGLTVTEVTNNGTTKAGSYYFSLQYADANGNGLTNPTTPVGPFAIYRDSLSFQNYLSGSPDQEITNKSIRVAISNLDPSYKYYNLIVIKSFEGIKESFVAATNPIGQTSYLYTGNTETEIPIQIDEVITPAVSYKTAKTISLADGTVLLGNLKSNPEYNLQPYFSKVRVLWQAKKELYQGAENSYANPLYCAYEVQYRRNEVYSFGIVIRWLDGSKSRTFYFINREKNKQSDGTVITRNFDQFQQLITSGEWDSFRYANNPDIYETGSIPERYKVYNTAYLLGDDSAGAAGPSLYGEFAYWESEDRYPDDSGVWGVNAGQPIRHFKMPDHMTVPLTDGEGLNRNDTAPIHIYKLGIRLENIEEVIASLPDEVRSKMAGWEIVRGDRSGNKSVIASGLLYNMWYQNWKQEGHNYIPNSNLSGFGITGDEDDIRLYANYPHNDLNPDYYFHKLRIGTEPAPSSESSQDRYRKDVFTMVSPDPSFNRVALVGNELLINSEMYGVSKTVQYDLEPYPLLKVRGDEANNVVYHTVSTGVYNNWVKPRVGNYRRKIQDCLYIPANATVGGSTVGLPIHNLTRESTVMVHVAKDLADPTMADTSRTHLTDPDYQPCGYGIKKSPVYRTVSGYYASIVNPIPNQYGSVYSVRFVYTNYDNFSVKNKSIIFGGDCFLAPYSIKRQLAFYQNLQSYITWEDNSEGIDFNTTKTIYGSRYYYEANRRNPANGDGTRTECADPREVAKLPAIFTGIPVFFCETDVNVALRLNGAEPWNTFYPNLKDGSLPVNRWTGVEYLNQDNSYLQNRSYSEANDLYPYATPDPFLNPNKPTSYHFDTRTIFSLTGSPESRFNNLLVFKPLNYYDFRRDYGALWDIRDVGAQRVLFRFESAVYMAGKYISIPVEQDKIVLGTGQLFQTAPAPLTRSDGGYAGTNAQWAFNNTPFGSFFIDSERGFVFQLTQSLGDISANGTDIWFFNNLPLALPKQIPAFVNIDNPANPDGIGYLSVYDHQNKLWILTKRDYALRKPDTAGYYSLSDTGKLLLNGSPVSLQNTALFEDKSWTFIYSPLTNRWVGWASFMPLHYSGFGKRFFSYDLYSGSAWEHNKGLPRTYYGRRYPFVIESVLRFDNGIQNVVNACTWLTRTSKLVDGQPAGELLDETFNKGVFYTETQSTGVRKLTVQDENDLSTLFKDEEVTDRYVESYLRVRDDLWQINDLYDVVKDPSDFLFVSDWANIQADYYIDKVVNFANMDYSRDYKKLVELRGYWMKYRLIYDREKDVQMHYYFSSSLNRISVK